MKAVFSELLFRERNLGAGGFQVLTVTAGSSLPLKSWLYT